MSRREAVLLASRAIAVYLLSWALADLTYIPEHLLAFAHHAGLSNLTSGNYFRDYDFVYLALLFVRIVTLFAAASWFYNCGAKVENFFFPVSELPGQD